MGDRLGKPINGGIVGILGKEVNDPQDIPQGLIGAFGIRKKLVVEASREPSSLGQHLIPVPILDGAGP